MGERPGERLLDRSERSQRNRSGDQDETDELHRAAHPSAAVVPLLNRPRRSTALHGPTGNLRAPALRKGRTLVIGFDEETYRKVFG